MNETCLPINDINCYFNRRWIEKTAIPEDKGHYGTFTIIDDKIEKQIFELLNELKVNPADKGKHNLYLVKELIWNESFDFQIPAIYINMVRQIKSQENLIVALCLLHTEGISTLFDFSCFDDIYRGDKYRLYLSHQNYTIPQYSYSEDTTWYQQYINEYSQKFYTLTGLERNDLTKIIPLEAMFAKNGITLDEDRNVETSYFEMTIEEFLTNPELVYDQRGAAIWDIILKLCKLDKSELIILNHKPSTLLVTKLLMATTEKTMLDDVKKILEWAIIRYFCEHVYDFYLIYHKYLGTRFVGSKTPAPKEKFFLNQLDDIQDHMIGEIYQEKYSRPEVVDTIDMMIETIIHGAQLLVLKSGLSSGTKIKAIDKLNKMGVKVGGPKVYERFEDIDIESTDLFYALIKFNRYIVDRYLLQRIDKPIETERWAMAAHHVNAYYSPSKNEIVLPCAIFQEPFYCHKAHPIVNYGGIGTIIGHEIIHGFDDQGRKYTAEGIYKDWWDPQDVSYYETEIQKKVIAHYSTLSLSGIPLDGNITVGENIADIGGLNIAFHSYMTLIHNRLNHELYLNTPLVGKKEIDTRILIQMFIQSWSRVWRSTMRMKKLQHRIWTDYHSPGPVRINAALSHFPAFYQTYLVGPKDKMYLKPEERSTFLITDYELDNIPRSNKQALLDLLHQYQSLYPNLKTHH
jgi:putative endopeptidase